LGSTYFENLKSGDAIRSSLLVHRNGDKLDRCYSSDFFPQRMVNRRCASPSSDTDFEGYCPPSSPSTTVTVPSEINTSDKQKKSYYS